MNLHNDKLGSLLSLPTLGRASDTTRLPGPRKPTPLFFVIMRLNLKVVLMCLCFAVFFVTLSFWSKCGDFALPRNFLPKWNHRIYDGSPSSADSIEEIDCLINQEYTVSCRREGDEIYLPFSFLHDYFEVFGSLSTTVKGTQRFDWSHSNAKVNYPKGIYDAKGIFMYFENYNVEMRDRVKCISAAEGVPLSTQWEVQGYYYPTQIAQFGLAHYSKNLTDPEPRIKIIEDAEKDQSEWIIPKESNLTRAYDRRVNSNVIHITTTSHYESAINLPLDHVLDLVLSIDILFRSNSSLIVTLQNRETKKMYNLYYIVADLVLSVQDENFYYGIGSNQTGWKHLTRDLLVDLQKGLQSTNGYDKKRKHRRTEIKVVSVSFLGTGSFDNLTFSTSEHIAQFYDAAEWFVKHQDIKTGGWPNPVKRKLSEFAELKQGWYSAMGQGHAISLLARAYHHSKGDSRYLRAAIDGLKPFRVPSRQGGVLARFLGKFDWYEEYPTTPASFVLNGFIYSLLGLYDLNATAPVNMATEARLLYEQGMVSLKKMLVLFDTGSGTIYDLRHFTLGIGPNIARWDYHATHVNQLLLLATIDRDPLIARTAERWRSYMIGKRSPHN